MTIGGVKTDQLVILSTKDVVNKEDGFLAEENVEVDTGMALFHEMVHGLRGHEGKRKLLKKN